MKENHNDKDLPQVGETVLYRYWGNGPGHEDGSKLFTCPAVVVAIHDDSLELNFPPDAELAGMVKSPTFVPHQSGRTQDGWSRG